MTLMKLTPVTVPSRFLRKCKQADLPADKFAEFTLSEVSRSILFSEIAKEFKKTFDTQKAR